MPTTDILTATTWDEFIQVIRDNHALRRHIREIRDTDAALAMIIRLSEPWRARAQAIDVGARRGRFQVRELETTHRLVRTGEPQRYADPETLSLLPSYRLGPTTRRTHEGRTRAQFWEHIRQLNWDGYTLRRERASARVARLDAVLHPYGDPPSTDDLARLRTMFRPAWQLAPVGGIRPAGITLERAMQIAIAVLERQERGR